MPGPPCSNSPAYSARRSTTIPAAIPYLHAEPTATAARPQDRPGLGRRPQRLARPHPQPARSLPWTRSAPSPASPGSACKKAWRRRAGCWTRCRPVRDFADTAAIVAGLDLVVSADTAVAHLAGGPRQAGAADGSLRQLLALAQRARRQPLVSHSAHHPAAFAGRLGKRGRPRRRLHNCRPGVTSSRMTQQGGIDCDVHPALPGVPALLPYLEPYWQRASHRPRHRRARSVRLPDRRAGQRAPRLAPAGRQARLRPRTLCAATCWTASARASPSCTASTASRPCSTGISPPPWPPR